MNKAPVLDGPLPNNKISLQVFEVLEEEEVFCLWWTVNTTPPFACKVSIYYQRSKRPCTESHLFILAVPFSCEANGSPQTTRTSK